MEGSLVPLLVAALFLTCVLAAAVWARRRLRTAAPAAVTGRGGFGRFLTPYRAPLTVAVVASLTLALIDLAAPWPFQLVIDSAIGDEPLPAWLSGFDGLSPAGLAAAAATAGVVLVAISALLGYFVAYLFGASQARAGSDLRSATFHKLQHAAVAFHDRSRTGDLVSRLTTDVSRVEEMTVAWFTTAIPQLVSLLGMLVIMVAIDATLTLVALLVIPLLAVWARRTHPRVRGAQRAARDKLGWLAQRATDVLRNVRAVQSFSRQGEEVARFRDSSDDAARAAIYALDVTARRSPMADLILAAGSGVVIYMGVLRVIDGSLTIGVLFVVLAYLNRMYGPIRALSRLVTTFAKGAASRDRLNELFSREHAVPEPALPFPTPFGSVDLEVHEVSFAYRAGTPILEDVSFTVAAGERVCVVGSTGVGKSTLLSLALRLYDPDAGTISLGGVDIRRLWTRDVRNLVTVVPQDCWILDGSIADNIAFGRADATEEDIRSAGARAMVDEFAEALPDGYDTVVGESGALLSGGQRRRIALARALLRDAPVLLLDEPTSGLDTTAERKILDVIEQATVGRATLMVSHRLNVARIADRVIVLHGGRVVEQGSHLRLLVEGGHFARLWESQHPRPGPVAAGDERGHRPLRAVPGRGEEVRSHVDEGVLRGVQV